MRAHFQFAGEINSRGNGNTAADFARTVECGLDRGGTVGLTVADSTESGDIKNVRHKNSSVVYTEFDDFIIPLTTAQIKRKTRVGNQPAAALSAVLQRISTQVLHRLWKSVLKTPRKLRIFPLSAWEILLETKNFPHFSPKPHKVHPNSAKSRRTLHFFSTFSQKFSTEDPTEADIILWKSPLSPFSVDFYP
jgi:hypothetical protein